MLTGAIGEVWYCSCHHEKMHALAIWLQLLLAWIPFVCSCLFVVDFRLGKAMAKRLRGWQLEQESGRKAIKGNKALEKARSLGKGRWLGKAWVTIGRQAAPSLSFWQPLCCHGQGAGKLGFARWGRITQNW